jgi:hypothetical protein
VVWGVVCNDFHNVTAEESSSIAAYTTGSYLGSPGAELGSPEHSRVELATSHGRYDWLLEARAGT